MSRTKRTLIAIMTWVVTAIILTVTENVVLLIRHPLEYYYTFDGWLMSAGATAWVGIILYTCYRIMLKRLHYWESKESTDQEPVSK